MRSVRKAPEHAILYAYGSTRSGAFAKNLYRGFAGVLQCDGYAGYNSLSEDVIRVGCFAHVRRKFYEAANVNGKVMMSRPLELPDKMFTLEREWKQWSPRARRRQRKRRLHKLMEKFWAWIDQANELPKSRLSKAITYAQNQRMALNKIIDYGSVDFSNNASERNMKSFVIDGREDPSSIFEDGSSLFTTIQYGRLLGAYPYFVFPNKKSPPKMARISQ